MLIKIHKTPDRKKMIAICDSNLIGKKFEEKGLQLDLRGDFYNGDELPEEEIRKVIKRAYIINAVGEKSVKFLITEKIIDKKNIITIKKIPHAQAMLMV